MCQSVHLCVCVSVGWRLCEARAFVLPLSLSLAAASVAADALVAAFAGAAASSAVLYEK